MNKIETIRAELKELAAKRDRHNRFYNEGGYGYNPYDSKIETKLAEMTRAEREAPEAPVAEAVKAAAPAKVYRDSRGMEIDPVALLADAEERLSRITDPFGRKLVQQSIDSYRKLLEG